MTSFSFDPQNLLGGMTQGVTNLPIIIGLPSRQNPVPNFIMGITTTERARTSSTLPGMQLTAGDLFLKSARNGSEFTFRVIVSETPNIKKEVVETVSKAIQQLSTIASSFANFGGVFPNTSGITSNFVSSQLSALSSMKDGFQPIMALNMFMPLSAFSIQNPYLTSSWYIDHVEHAKEEAERGVVVDVTLRELLMKRDPSFTLLTKVAANLANQLVGPGVGSSIGSLL